MCNRYCDIYSNLQFSMWQFHLCRMIFHLLIKFKMVTQWLNNSFFHEQELPLKLNIRE